MIGIFDADSLVYRIGFACQRPAYKVTCEGHEPKICRNMTEVTAYRATLPVEASVMVEMDIDVDPENYVYHSLRTTIDGIHDKLGIPLQFYISGKDNFREKLATIQPYKGNRSPFSKPRHYSNIRKWLVERYKAMVVDGQEADDEVGIVATELGKDGMIISQDKDLDTVPGLHYNWVKDERYDISERQGLKNFYTQMLVGDRVDNIPGLQGVGPKTAEKLLDGCVKEGALWGAVYRAYFDKYGHRYDDNHTLGEALLEIGRLLKIRTKRDEPLWEPPK